ncbi:MAG: hypothetical protein HZA93_09955 [Verrucomicrobia bacterium]|nr:hypothetical protein [Verrucomicrobiota bacterium]
MSRSASVLALADDLTGAAEIAAIGHRAGWRSQVATRIDELDATDLLALDTDTRLLPPAEAARTVAAAAAGAASIPWRLIYKKTDSVLRGPVLAELTALAAALGRKRVLFVPCNPGLGRTIRDGRYYIGGVPLNETAFARDPHHPARRARVADLLRWSALPSTRLSSLPVDSPQRVEVNALHLENPDCPIHVLPPGSALPDSGVIVGEAATSADVAAWATRLDADTLPAGGGEFFAAVLHQQIGCGDPPSRPVAPVRPTLHVCGSLAAPHRPTDLLELPSLDDVLAALARRPVVAIGPPARRSADPAAPARLRRALANLVAAAAERGAFRHLMIEGGATAAEILATLQWTRLTVVHEWAQGVVSLRPATAPDLLVTMKPGSYAWPESLWEAVAVHRSGVDIQE